MGDRAGDSAPAGRRRIGDEAMGVFLTALRRGARHEEAAREAGFSRSAFFRLRKRDGVFAARWEDAISFSSGPRYISSGNGRRLQLRRIRSVRFTAARKDIFLARFAGTCNLAESAEKAGVGEATVFEHRANDPDFAARFNQALEQTALPVHHHLGDLVEAGGDERARCCSGTRPSATGRAAMGAFDAPTGTRFEMHIHVADKGDYYDIADGLPQNPR